MLIILPLLSLNSNDDQDQPANTGEEIEFSVSSVGGEASEIILFQLFVYILY